MAQRIEKKPLELAQHNYHVGIVQAEFNSEYTQQQLTEAIRFLDEYAISYDIIRVAGCFELPYAVEQLAQTRKYTAIVAVGCLIKGATIHFDVIATSVTQTLMNISVAHHIPVGFGVITADTAEQAQERVSIGYDAAYAAIQSASQLSGASS